MRFSIRSLLLILTVAAVCFSFVKVAGGSWALSALKPAAIFAVVVWAMGWGPAETKGRIGCLPVVMGTMCAVAIAGLLYYYFVWHTLDPWRILAERQRTGVIQPTDHKGDSLFHTWTLWGGCIGALAGAVYSLMTCRHHSVQEEPANADQPQCRVTPDQPSADD